MNDFNKYPRLRDGITPDMTVIEAIEIAERQIREEEHQRFLRHFWDARSNNNNNTDPAKDLEEIVNLITLPDKPIKLGHSELYNKNITKITYRAGTEMSTFKVRNSWPKSNNLDDYVLPYGFEGCK